MPGDLQFLEGYAGQSTDELIALEGVYRVDSLTGAFGEAIRLKSERVGIDGLTETERAVLAVEAVTR